MGHHILFYSLFRCAWYWHNIDVSLFYQGLLIINLINNLGLKLVNSINRGLNFPTVYIYCYTFPNLFTSSNHSLPFLPLRLPTTLYLLLHFIIFFLIFWLFFSPILFLYKFDIISLIQFIFFLQKNCECSLSLSLFGFLFFLITLIKVDGFFLYMFWYCIF